jgi:predicted transcriptional regulator
MDTGKTIKNALRKKVLTVSVDDTFDTDLKTMARDDATALLVKIGDEPVGIITISDILYSLA